MPVLNFTRYKVALDFVLLPPVNGVRSIQQTISIKQQ